MEGGQGGDVSGTTALTLSGPEQVQHTGHAVESTAEKAVIGLCL